jgi:hypothetical protein
MVPSPAWGGGGRGFRSVLSGILLTLAALSLLVGSLGLYVWATVVSSDGFADRVDHLRADPAVQQEFSDVVATSIINAAPALVSVKPLLEQLAAGVVASDAAAPVIRNAPKACTARYSTQARTTWCSILPTSAWWWRPLCEPLAPD